MPIIGVYNSTSQKKRKERTKERKCKVHIVSTSLVFLSFLLDSLISFYLFIYLFILIFLMVVSRTHVWIFTKPTTVGNYVYTLLQILHRGS